MLYRLSGLKKTFASRTVLDIPELEIEAGQIYALLGPNGAGKTTLLNILGFLDAPSGGRLFYRSQAVGFQEAALQPLRREVVVLDQHPILFSTSVYKNLEFGLKIRAVSQKERERLIHQSLEMVGMQDFAGAAAHRLSGGETQRVALARALALAPRVLLCDEPTSNVDVENQSIILDILRQINEHRHHTVIFTTHDRSLASRLAGRLLVLDRGRLIPGAYENVFTGRLISWRGNRVRFAFDRNPSVRVAVSKAGPAHEFGRVFVDPFKIQLYTAEAKGGGANEFIGNVTRLSAENTHVWVVVDIGVDLTAHLTVDDYDRHPLRIGQTLGVSIPDEAIRVGE
jgi:tungstate transport system ATP-binding protein